MEHRYIDEQLGIPVKSLRLSYRDGRFPQFGILVGEEGKGLPMDKAAFERTLGPSAHKNGVVLVKALSPQQREALREGGFAWGNIPERSDYSCIPHSDEIAGGRRVSAFWAQRRLPHVNTGFAGIQPGAKVMLRHLDLCQKDVKPDLVDEWLEDRERFRRTIDRAHLNPESLAAAIDASYCIRTYIPDGRGHVFVRAVHADLARKAVWANWAKVELAVVAGEAFHFGGKGSPCLGDILVSDLLPQF
jgi:hypothetical protein